MSNKKLENGNFLKIEELYAFIATDEEGEGIMGFQTVGGMMPMVGADMDRVNSLKIIAEQIKKATGKPYEIRKFKVVKDGA